MSDIARKNALIYLYQFKTNKSTIIYNNIECDYSDFSTEFFSMLRDVLESKKDRLINVYNNDEAILNSYLTSIYKNICNTTISKLDKNSGMEKI